MGSLRRIKATVQYDGTGYFGFQRQVKGLTVQEVLEKALGRLLGHEVKVRGAGRTDAGVHARGQVIAFDTDSCIPAERIPEALSGYLPDDILVLEAQDVESGFDPRRHALSKTYCYRLSRNFRPDLFVARYALWYPGYLDWDRLVEETAYIPGTHDFVRFRATGSSAKTTVRTVLQAKWVRLDTPHGELWEFWVEADGFLYKMVRMLVGTLIDVGRGYLQQGTIREALKPSESVKVGRCAPARGLCLEQVKFS